MSREIGKGFGRVCSIVFLHDSSAGWSGPRQDMVYARISDTQFIHLSCYKVAVLEEVDGETAVASKTCLIRPRPASSFPALTVKLFGEALPAEHAAGVRESPDGQGILQDIDSASLMD